MSRPTGKQIRSFMKKHGLTLDAMAELSGLGRATIARYRKHGTARADPYRVHHLIAFMAEYERQKGDK